MPKHGFGGITYNYNVQMNYLTDWKEDTNGDGTYELAVEYDYSKQGNPKYKSFKDVSRNIEIARENYAWNDRDELTAITGRVTESYVYDYRGLRNIKDSNGSVSKYVYLQNNQPAFKYNVSANTYDVFVYEGSKRIARVRIDSMGTVIKDYFVNDYQGSPVAVVDDSQSIKYQNYNDPFGNMEMSIGVPSSNPEFKYTDKELDEDSGLYYFQARYMDPIAGRFYGRDRVRLEGKTTKFFMMNSYIFAKNNPIKFFDPNGEDAIIYTTNALPFVGHTGSYYQDQTGSWSKEDLFSAEGDMVGTIKNLLGISTKADIKITPMGMHSKEEMLEIVKADKTITNFRYLEIDDPAKDQAIFDAFNKFKLDADKGSQLYNLYFENCVTGTTDTLVNMGGVDLDRGWNTVPTTAWSYMNNPEKYQYGDGLNIWAMDF